MALKFIALQKIRKEKIIAPSIASPIMTIGELPPLLKKNKNKNKEIK